MRWSTSRRHAQVERHDDEAGAHRAEVDGRQGGRRRAPGQQPVAGLEAQPTKPPRGELRVGVGGPRPTTAARCRRPCAARTGACPRSGSRSRRAGRAASRTCADQGSPKAAMARECMWRTSRFTPCKYAKSQSADRTWPLHGRLFHRCRNRPTLRADWADSGGRLGFVLTPRETPPIRRDSKPGSEAPRSQAAASDRTFSMSAGSNVGTRGR